MVNLYKCLSALPGLPLAKELCKVTQNFPISIFFLIHKEQRTIYQEDIFNHIII